MSLRGLHQREPGHGDVNINPQLDISRFENAILPGDSPVESPITKHYSTYYHNGSSAGSLKRSHPMGKMLIGSVLGITIPLALVTAALLSLVFGYEVKTQPTLFPSTSIQDNSRPSGYILVNFSATRIVFAASFLSTIAPLLTTCVMALWSVMVAASMRRASETQDMLNLPSLNQMSMIVGLSLASNERLRAYYRYLVSRTRRSTVAPVLHAAAAVMTFAIMLGGAVFIADTCLHYYSATVEFDQIQHVLNPPSLSGRGLASRCLDYNRTNHYNYECSVQTDDSLPPIAPSLNEVFDLQHNTSGTSQIRIVELPESNTADLGVLIPSEEALVPELEYSATTFGVSVQCAPIDPELCNMRLDPANQAYTLFNCTNSFWGALGKQPNITEINSASVAVDYYLSSLAFKPSPNLQYSFFSDSALQHLYNPEGFNESNTTDFSSGWPDSALQNEIYAAFAVRIIDGSSQSGTPLANGTDGGVFTSDQFSYYDMVMNCSISSYDVQYAWVDSRIQDVAATDANATLTNMFHSYQALDYISLSGSNDPDLQDNLMVAAREGTSASLANRWADLYAIKVLSVIGGFSTPRTTMQEQTRNTILVAKIPIGALATLVAASLLYVATGIVLAVKAYYAATPEVEEVAARLSLPGITDAAFGVGVESSISPGGTAMGNQQALNEKLVRGETRRVLVDGSQFTVWV